MRQPVPFGKYLLLDRISVGGMAEVFKAKSYGVEGFEKIIAIKRILPTMGEDRDFIKMFIDEAKIAGQLAHANICQIFELGRIDGSHFIAMEYIWGKDLLQIQNRLRKIKQAMPVPMACFVIAKVLEGLDYAHRKRDPLGRPLEIVHRDCSPQNVLVSYEGEVKVIDFGIAKATSRNSRTMAGVLKGKFGYMSPEQVRGLPLDRRSDIFALGTMIYECLTSERLFQGETDFSTLEKVRNVDIRPPREINPNIPEAVERVILKALAKDVDDRYQWCSEMLADLQQYLMSQDVVFTAKSLSSWLKEVFNAEIDKERQLLEQYKRVGRDGLIQGLPAAEAKMDVVENLGEAGAPEGDATQLGGPSFEDIEAQVAASAGPALGSPAARGSRPPSEAEDGGDFENEAPTEIFGEIDNAPKPVAAAPSRPSTSAQPATRPPKPPPRAPTGAIPSMTPNGRSTPANAALNAAAQAANERTMNVTDSDLEPADVDAARQAYAQNFPQLAARASGQAPAHYPQGSQQRMGHTPPPQTAQGFPAQPMGSVPPPQVANALASGPSQGKTLMGAAAPPELAQYAAAYAARQSGPTPGYPMNPSAQMGAQPRVPSQPQMSAMPMNPSQPQMAAMNSMMPMNPSQPHMLAHPSGQMPNQMPGQMGYPAAQNYLGQGPGSGQMPGYGQYQPGPAPALEPAQAQQEGRKKSSIGRDVAIGVAIAAVVLGGFLAVKFLVLDADDSPSADEPASSLATLKLELRPDDTVAELFFNDNKTREQLVKNGQELPINPGKRKIRIVSKDGQVCEQEITLEAGKSMLVACEFKAIAAGSDAGKGSSDGQGSADAGKGSSDKPDTKVADAGKGSADKPDTKAPDTKAPDTKAPDTKAPDTKKPPDTKVPDTKVPDTKKPPDIKVPDTKKPADTKVPDPKKPPDTKKPPDKMPPEDNPADRLGALSDGFVVVTSKPKARLAVDGVDTGLSTPTKLKLTPGKHKIQFSWGTTKTAFPVTVKSGETLNFHKDLE